MTNYTLNNILVYCSKEQIMNNPAICLVFMVFNTNNANNNHSQKIFNIDQLKANNSTYQLIQQIIKEILNLKIQNFWDNAYFVTQQAVNVINLSYAKKGTILIKSKVIVCNFMVIVNDSILNFCSDNVIMAISFRKIYTNLYLKQVQNGGKVINVKKYVVMGYSLQIMGEVIEIIQMEMDITQTVKQKKIISTQETLNILPTNTLSNQINQIGKDILCELRQQVPSSQQLRKLNNCRNIIESWNIWQNE
ncbi:hypothetical protein ABPG73_021196 [Tetrahymena malaccensis]